MKESGTEQRFNMYTYNRCKFNSLTHSLITNVPIHMLMRDEKKGKKKQARSYKQQGKATQHTQGMQSLFQAASGGTRTHDTPHSRQSALL